MAGKPAPPVLSLAGLNPACAVEPGPGWERRVFTVDMSPHWQDIPWQGSRISLRGHNIFTLPAPSCLGGPSARFDPDAPLFGGFAGLYVIPPVNGQRVPPELVPELANRDNLAWGRRFGDPAPRSEWSGRITRTGPDNWRADLQYRWNGDLGPGNPQTGTPPLLTIPPELWQGRLAPYCGRTDAVSGRIWYQGDYLLHWYCNNTRVHDLHGRLIDTLAAYPELREIQERMAASVRIIDRGTGYRGPRPLTSDAPR
ncbi:hypothetical protein ABZ078_36935 [Streptomyces sp. NPDC006385]|uniref:hypothetical protein n=1 Tax=Streptomyces sp. NPDC006385 TaxID=3156761 RepID=UPI0033BBD5BA